MLVHSVEPCWGEPYAMTAFGRAFNDPVMAWMGEEEQHHDGWVVLVCEGRYAKASVTLERTKYVDELVRAHIYIYIYVRTLREYPILDLMVYERGVAMSCSALTFAHCPLSCPLFAVPTSCLVLYIQCIQNHLDTPIT